jgi:hypothetical protein
MRSILRLDLRRIVRPTGTHGSTDDLPAELVTQSGTSVADHKTGLSYLSNYRSSAGSRST